MVTWGMYRPTKESLLEFLNQPTWLTLKVWQRHQENHVQQVNALSVSAAKMSLLLEMGFNSFAGGKGKVDADFSKYLPFQVYNGKDKLEQQTVNIFWELIDLKMLPLHVQRAIDINKDLINELKAKKEQ